LLGPNGAGKTTTINILTGFLLNPTARDIRLLNHSILSDSSPIHRYVGVCPQFDVLWDEFTVQEHLTFQCRQKGLQGPAVYSEVQRVANLVSLDGDAFRSAAKTLSGGMKRRLSIGMSIVGNPQILILDEPSAGLDPENKQQVWQVIHKLRSPHRLILLTTHSMDEAEVLCNRIGILAKGQLKCIGTAMHLKTKYSLGYTLTLNMRYPTTVTHSLLSQFHLRETARGGRADGNISNSSAAAGTIEGEGIVAVSAVHPHTSGVIEDAQLLNQLKVEINKKVDQFILEEIGKSQAQMINVVNHTRRYALPKSVVSLSEVYELMEQVKTEHHIQEWGISLTSLEEVFISAVE
jgi:ABC-type multidrug transport system ATPase subunit